MPSQVAHFYLDESRSSVSILIQLFAIHDNPRHSLHEYSKEWVSQIAGSPNLECALLALLCSLHKQITVGAGQTHPQPIVVDFLCDYQNLLIELLICIGNVRIHRGHPPVSPQHQEQSIDATSHSILLTVIDSLMEIECGARIFRELQLVARGDGGHRHTLKHHSKSVEFLCSILFIVHMDLWPMFSDDDACNRLADNFDAISTKISKLPPSYFSGCVHFSVAAACMRVSDFLETQQASKHDAAEDPREISKNSKTQLAALQISKKHAMRAFSEETINHWHHYLDSSHFNALNASLRKICNYSITSSLSLFMSVFDNHLIPDLPKMILVLSRCMCDDVLSFHACWNCGGGGLLGDFLKKASGWFPMRAAPLLSLASCFLHDAVVAESVFQLLLHLDVCAQPANQLQSHQAVHEGNQLIRAKESIPLYGNISLPLGSCGLYVEEGGDGAGDYLFVAINVQAMWRLSSGSFPPIFGRCWRHRWSSWI